MKSLKEWQETNNTKTITVTCRDLDDNLENLLKYIKKIGNIGHSFTIVVDPGSGREKKFGWDGDGSDSIKQIEIQKAGTLKLAMNIEGEPEEMP